MYVKVTSGQPSQFPYTVGQLRRDNPQTSFPRQVPDSLLAEYGVYPCTRPRPDDYDHLAWRLVDGELTNVDGAWVLPYKLEALPLEQAQSNIRSRRDNLLQTTDWIVAKSYERGEAVPAAWATYRQALRDVTAQEGFPYSVEWPSKPE